MSGENPSIGPYKLLELLGLGGMGVVYKARHHETGDIVALKTIRLLNEEQLDGIRREIRTLARIRHPGIVRIVTEGLQDGLPWYAMDLVEGVTLRQYFLQQDTSPLCHNGVSWHGEKSKDAWWTTSHPGKIIHARVGDSPHSAERAWPWVEQFEKETNGSLPVSTGYKAGDLPLVLSLFRKLCSPLAFLHGEGIIHGDLKPDNIMVTEDGTPVLVDFGLMSWFTGDKGREILTVQEGNAGTVIYMAPEQFKGEILDARTDLYALGCILYELLVGQPPSGDMDPASVILAHLHGSMPPPIPPSHVRRDVRPEIDDLVSGLLAREPRERIGHADVVATTLARFCSDNCGNAGSKPKAYLYRSRYAGRDLYLARLREYTANLKNGKGGVVLVGGESGVGKTRLVMEFAREIARENIVVITGECTDRAGYSLEAFQKFLQMIANRCRERGLPETERLLGKRGKVLALYEQSLQDLPGQERYPDPLALNPDEAGIRLFSYLSETLMTLASDGPLVFIIDDLHWADELTLGYIEFVLRTRNPALPPVLAIGTYRSEEVGERLQTIIDTNGVGSITISRLPEEAVCMMIGDMLAMDPAPQLLCRYLSRHSEGNPYFVAEYLRAAVDEGLLERDDQGRWRIAMEAADGIETEEIFDRLTLPLSLKGLLERQQSGLSERACSMIKTAAVIGREAHILLLWELSQLDDVGLTETIEELLHHHIVETAGSGLVRFVHDKIREVSLAKLQAKEAQMLHRRVAEVIETLFSLKREEYVAELGVHWEKAGESRKAQFFYLAAARREKNRGDHSQAERFYSAYLRLLTDDTEESLAARREYADILEGMGRYDNAMREYTRIFTHSLDQRIRATCLRKKAFILGLQGDVQGARDAYEESLSMSGHHPLEQAGTLNDMAYYVGHHQGDVDEAEHLCERALELILLHYPSAGSIHGISADNEGPRQHRIESRKTLAQTFRRFGLVHWLRSDLDQALEYYKKSLAISQEIDDRMGIGSVAGNIGIIYALRGDHECALEYLHQYLAVSKEIDNKRSIGSASGNIGLVYHDCGELVRAFDYLHQSLTVFEEIGDKQNVGMASSNIGLVHFYRGDLDSALVCYEKSLIISEEIEYKRGIGSASCNIGHVYLTRGNLERAIEYFQKSQDINREIDDKAGEAEALLELSEVYRLMSNLNGAIQTNLQAMELFEEAGSDLRSGDCWCYRAKIAIDGADFSAARESLAKAEEFYNRQLSGEYSWQMPLLRVRLAIAESRTENAAYRSERVKTVISQARDLVDRSRETHRMHFKIKANLLMGMAFTLEKSPELALIFFEEALAMAQERGFGLLERQILKEMERDENDTVAD